MSQSRVETVVKAVLANPEMWSKYEKLLAQEKKANATKILALGDLNELKSINNEIQNQVFGSSYSLEETIDLLYNCSASAYTEASALKKALNATEDLISTNIQMNELAPIEPTLISTLISTSEVLKAQLIELEAAESLRASELQKLLYTPNSNNYLFLPGEEVPDEGDEEFRALERDELRKFTENWSVEQWANIRCEPIIEWEQVCSFEWPGPVFKWEQICSFEWPN